MGVADKSIASHVSGDRLWDRLMALARFGATEAGGVCRLALTREEIEARAELVKWARDIGLEPSVDGVANLFLRLEGSEPELPPILTGSHIDTQPTGGKYDGAYGVMAALESVEAIARSGRRPRRSIDVVAWVNEEGSRFAPGMMGSAVFAGFRRMEEVEALTDADGCSVREALAQVLAAEEALPRRPVGFPVAAFVEAHIEQGVVLEREATTIGVVIGIQGKRTIRVEIQGEDSHAGTTPRSARRDALVSAVNVVQALQDAMWDEADTVRFTIGKFTVTPNAPSVVPGKVVFSIDLRHDDAETVQTLGDKIPGICEAASGKCTATVHELLHDKPLEFPTSMRGRISDAAARLGLSHMELPSPAGHDARYLHYICPTGMLFIPCKGGISHNEAESVTKADATAGAQALTEVLFDLAEQT